MPPALLRPRGLAVLLAGLAFLCSPGRSSATGVSVAPSRILLEGRTFAATIYLTNRGTETNTYRVGLTKLRMLESGEILPAEASPDAGELFADDLIRWSPRRCVIPPGGSQTVRLLVRRPRGNMPQKAEYRTHLSVRSIPNVPRLEEIEDGADDTQVNDGSLSVQAVAAVETLVPVIIRFGRLEAAAGIEAVSLRPGLTPRVDFDLTRQGDRSLYGDLHFVHVDADGDESDLGHIRGLAVYTPITRRRIEYELRVPDGVDLARGSLRIDFEETEDGGGDATVSVSTPLARAGTD